MKNGRLQAKDVPEGPILLHLLRAYPRWTLVYELPGDFPDKVVLAKMASLIRRGLVDGCTCGCRGDFYLTGAGLELARRLFP